MRDGLAKSTSCWPGASGSGRAQAALIAVDPRTGEILALVGGRSYNQSQFNRAVAARRQPGSVFKPFVYLAAFERAAAEGRTDRHAGHAGRRRADDVGVRRAGVDAAQLRGRVRRRRSRCGGRWRCRATSRTIKVAEKAGYDHVAALWKTLGVGNDAAAYPSIALGVFEASPFEIATAYTIFPNGGHAAPAAGHRAHRRGGNDDGRARPAPAKTIARADTTFLVTNMMRSVINEGTGAGARAAGFTLDAAGKSGTTNDLRDAWFVGFTPELLTVVWVGFDDNQPLGPERHAGGAAHLDDVHEPRAGRARRPPVRRARAASPSWRSIATPASSRAPCARACSARLPRRHRAD